MITLSAGEPAAVYQQLDDYLGQDEEPYDIEAGLERLQRWMGDETPQRASEEASDKPAATKANSADPATAGAADRVSPRSRRGWRYFAAAAAAVGIAVAADAARRKAQQSADAAWRKAWQSVHSADESGEHDDHRHHDTATT